MHILSGISKCIGRSTSRERERRENCVCVISEFCHFFNSENSSTYFKVSSTDLCRTVTVLQYKLDIKVGIFTRQCFGFLKETKV